jgi:methylenetetrahydrofolate reductase (NADPH)
VKIRELFRQGKPVVSFEIFPPKPSFPLETVFDTIKELKELKPAFISVTYGAGGGSSSRTIEIADKVKNCYQIEVLTHLTCVGLTRERIEDTLDRMRSHGIENILALRGDPPAGMSSFVAQAGGYKYAKDLVAHIKAGRRFCVAAAAYPEGHLECRDLDRDVEYLKLKVDEGVDFLITQLFFENDVFYGFRERLAKAGISCPVSVGVMPVLNAAQIDRITALCGASIPVKLKSLLDKYGHCPGDMEKAGVEYACVQIADLIENRAEGIHLYTMNKAEQTKRIMEQLGMQKDSEDIISA